MALLNRIFSTRKKPFNKCQDNVCDKLFTFNIDQVRIVVFRECDFRGRKLLFDSHSVQKVVLEEDSELSTGDASQQSAVARKYVEVSNGHGYMYSKPNGDVARLGEMIFGSVAMSYRGTTYKVHSLPEPPRLMCSQVFPSPKNPVRARSSAPSHIQVHNKSNTNSSLEQSIRLEDSGASSATSCSDQSVQSGTSDTVLVCKRQRSIPLDVPVNSSLVSSSGYGEENSYSSISSGPQSIPIDLSQGNSQFYSSDSLCKKWARTTSMSLEPSNNSLGCSVSTDESFAKVHVRSSKIGLAILIQLSHGQEEKLEHFLMEHAALIELLLWRIRRGAEGAYIRHSTFVSIMHEITGQTANWLVDLLTGANMFPHVWKSILSNCDNLFSIITKSSSINFLGHLSRTRSECSVDTTLSSNDDPYSVRMSNLTGGGLFMSFKHDSGASGNDFSFLNLSRFLKVDRDITKKTENALLGEKFIKEFCELMEIIDAKDTNFFISTLVTAVLTHHLGWVSTSLPHTINADSSRNSCNPLWNQLSDLYGAVGNPVKMSRTIITGSNKPELIQKIISALTYFIRCAEVNRYFQNRVDIDVENKKADLICSANSCIPKENYKKYEDHLREMEFMQQTEKLETMFIETNQKPLVKPVKSMSLTKTHTCLTELDKLTENSDVFNKSVCQSDMLERVSTLGIQSMTAPTKLDTYNVTCSVLDNLDPKEQQLIDISEAKQQIERIFSPKKSKSTEFSLDSKTEESRNDKNVVFVLGENDKLVGLKRDNIQSKRPTDLNLRLQKNIFFCGSDSSPDEAKHEKSEFTFGLKSNECTSAFEDSDFVEYEIATDVKPSTSFTALNLNLCEDKKLNQSIKDVCRAQSEPPEGAKSDFSPSTTRYKYSGVKFNFQQYPQIVENYMKSKNIELSNMQFSEKKLDLLWQSGNAFDFPKCEEPTDFEESEPLTTPSNASELEFTSDLVIEKPECRKATETLEVPTRQHEFSRNLVPNTIIKQSAIYTEKNDLKHFKEISNMKMCEEKAFTNLKIVEMPMPQYEEVTSIFPSIDYTTSLIRGFGDHYISDMVLQGTAAPKHEWEALLKKDLVLSAQRSFTNQQIEESIAIVADTDTWEVQLMSSHRYVIDRSASGVPVGMSQLVANMLDTLLQMWRLQAPAEYCIMHIEQQLQEFCMRSKSLAQLLLDTDFCSMEMLTSSLRLEVNDVPLLMAVASTHTPQVTQKYGLSFQ